MATNEENHGSGTPKAVMDAEELLAEEQGERWLDEEIRTNPIYKAQGDKQRTYQEKKDCQSTKRKSLGSTSEKLQIHGTRFVLESDGTSVDNDEVLKIVSTQTLILLTNTEDWEAILATTATTSIVAGINEEKESASDSFSSTSEDLVVAKTTQEIANSQISKHMWNTLEIPWHRLSKEVLGKCEKGIRQKSRPRTDFDDHGPMHQMFERLSTIRSMEGIVEENGSVDPLAPSPDPPVAIVSSVGVTNNQSHLMTATNIVQLTLPQTQAQVQSVIQPNQQSVIQTATNLPPVLSKGNVILVSKPNSVIQTAQANLQTLQVVDAPSDDSFSEEESPKKRRDLLTRRPSYRKILNDLGGGEIAGT
ncbi:cyclic amp response element-binding protein b [Holotrichia oblita]|uniref:Cyclic amp response element-binding protein b n=1 Tax=Holotrichia oblita TaxID=644536 RepID=A0ACB9T3Z9_HOLOL|nr:cyclic amp response element-binding protein b [Holotrichia oblita]